LSPGRAKGLSIPYLSPFYEKVGDVKHSNSKFQIARRGGFTIFAPTSATLSIAFWDTPPFHLSSPAFQGGEKVPQLAMGLFRRPVRNVGDGAVASTVPNAFAFCLAQCCAAPSPQPLLQHIGHLPCECSEASENPLVRLKQLSRSRPHPILAHASIRTVYELL
jgi:hypothetical protein